MGLDMYLTRKIYIGGYFEHRKVQGTIEIDLNDFDDKPSHISVKPTEVSEIILQVGYWRKANQIHAWFVKNVQEGKDECQESYVGIEKLHELRALCVTALATKDASLLPPQKGFFFGGTNIDEYYWTNLKRTIEMLDNLPEDGEYYYRASW